MKKFFEKKNLFYLLISFLGLLVLSILLFYPALKVGFIGDDFGIINNFKILVDPLKTSNFRPLLTSFFYLIEVTNFNTFWPHLILIFSHIVNIFLVLILIYYFTRNKLFSFLVALTFAVYYRNPEMIYYLSQSETLFLTFYLSAFLSFIYFLDTQKKIFYVCSITLFLLAILAHPLALVFLPMIIIFQWLYKKQKIGLAKTILTYLPFIIIALGYYLMIVWSLINLRAYTLAENNHHLVSLKLAISNFINLLLGLLPFKFDQSYLVTNSLLIKILTPLLLVGSVLLLLFQKIEKNIRFFVAWIILPLILYALISPLGPKDRYLYLSSMGFLFLIFYFVVNLKSWVLLISFSIFWIGLSSYFFNARSLDWQKADQKVKNIEEGMQELFPAIPGQNKHIYTINFPLEINPKTPILTMNPYDLFYYHHYGALSSFQNIQDREIGEKLETIPPTTPTEGVYIFYYKDDKVFDFSDRYPKIKEMLLEKLKPEDIRKNFQDPYLWDYHQKDKDNRIYYRISKGQVKISYRLSENGWVLLLNNDLPILPKSKGFSVKILGDGQAENLNIDFWDIQSNQSLRFKKKIDFSGWQEIKGLYSEMEQIGPVDLKGINRLKITLESEKAISGKLMFKDFDEF